MENGKETIELKWEPTNEAVGKGEIEDEWEPSAEKEGKNLLVVHNDKLEWLENSFNNKGVDLAENRKIAEIKENHYKNLMNKELQNKFKDYFNETGKYANHGTKIKKDFIDKIDENIKKDGITIKEKQNLENLKQVCIDIDQNLEIKKYIIGKIKNTSLNQTEISNESKKLGFYVSDRYVAKVSIENVFDANKEAHKKRFSKEVPLEIKERILDRLEKEVKKDNPNSLYKIHKDFPEVSKTYIDKLAHKTFSQDIYQKTWSSTQTGSKEKITEILEREATKENPKSLRSVAKEANASAAFVNDLAKEIYPYNYQEIWPAIEKIPEEIKNHITKTIKEEAQKENPRTLRKIHKDFPEVGADTIKRLAKQTVPKEVHDKAWLPLTTEIPQEVKLKIKNVIKREIKKSNPKSLTQIAKEFTVSGDSVGKIAKSIISQEEYEKLWSFHERLSEESKEAIAHCIREKTNLNIQEIATLHEVSNSTVSQISQDLVFKGDLDAHKERFPMDKSLELGNYIHQNLNAIVTKAIYENHTQKYYTEPNIYPDKRRPDGMILEDENFLRDRLTNPKNGQYLKDTLRIDSNKLDHIKATQFDFTNNISDENIMNKIEKYHSKDTFLMIIGTRWYLYEDTKPLPEDTRIKYPENIKVISHSIFADLIGLEGDNRNIYNNIVDLNYNHDLNSLKALYNYDLSFINTHNTEELKEDLIQKDFIKENFYEYFDFEVLNNKDDNGKQLDLDYFLKS